MLHAGDVVSGATLDELTAFAPTYAVLGNNDLDLRDRLPERRSLCLAGVPVAMVHDSGARRGRPERLHRWVPDARVVVFGHSHEPVAEMGVGGQLLFNPGSPTQRRRQRHPTMGVLELDGGRVTAHRIVVVDHR